MDAGAAAFAPRLQMVPVTADEFQQGMVRWPHAAPLSHQARGARPHQRVSNGKSRARHRPEAGVSRSLLCSWCPRLSPARHRIRPQEHPLTHRQPKLAARPAAESAVGDGCKMCGRRDAQMKRDTSREASSRQPSSREPTSPGTRY